jgi:hypothetical protein
VRLLAEASCEQVIDMLGDVAAPAIADPGERGTQQDMAGKRYPCA